MEDKWIVGEGGEMDDEQIGREVLWSFCHLTRDEFQFFPDETRSHATFPKSWLILLHEPLRAEAVEAFWDLILWL